MIPQDKWKSNQEKVAFLKTFPGLMTAWAQAKGKTLEHWVPFPGHKAYAALLFSNGHFCVTSALQDEPQLLTTGLQLLRPRLEPLWSDAFREYDRRHALDAETGRQVRMDNIINAITNNLEAMPELKSRIREMVRAWDS